MNRISSVFSIILTVGIFWGVSVAQARPAPESFADLAESLLPVVVNISTTQKVQNADATDQLEDLFRDFLDRQDGDKDGDIPKARKATSLGSGVIIDPEGYIVTNNHVIENAEEITVTTHDNKELKAKLVGIDDKTDLALLKVESKEKLPAAKWGDADKLRVGDWVMAIGNPFGLGGTVTVGIVSARQRDIQIGQYDDFIQTDASINRGNSGGPMFDMDGEVVGINTIIFSPSGGSIGIGFAISSTLVKPVIEQLKNGGKVRRALLGVSLQAVTGELAEGMHLPRAEGALIANVTEGGPADKAGIKQGDVILEFDNKPIKEMRTLPRLVADAPIGEKVPVVVYRKGERMTINVVLGELTEAAQRPQQKNQPQPSEQSEEGYHLASLGLSMSRLDDKTRKILKLPSEVEGVLITGIDENGSAAAKGLTKGDVIVEVDQKTVLTPKDVEARVKDAQDNGYRVVTLLINREGSFNWVALKLNI
jgi:serine protease Do